MSVFAPFRFAPVNTWIHEPDWGDRVSHDVPFADGLSGTIELELTARSPMLVGGARRPPKKDNAGEVWPTQLPDGRWIIPPASIQGPVRAALRLVGFGRLGALIDDKRFGIRDLSPAANPYYGRRLNKSVKGRGRGDPIRVTPLVQTGWLRRSGGKVELARCSLARIQYEDVEATLGIAPRNLRAASTTSERYGWATNPLSTSMHVDNMPQSYPHAGGRLQISYRTANGGRGRPTTAQTGHIVLTGMPGTSRKHMEFFFYNPQWNKLTGIEEEVFQNFESIHAPDDGRDTSDAWKFYRDTGYPLDPETGGARRPFRNGGWMPVFFLEENGRISCIFLAFMGKIGHTHTTHQLLQHSSTRHFLRKENRLDLPSLIFGHVAEDTDSLGVKRRAAFDLALAELPNGRQPGKSSELILLSPKPSYFPVYVTQPQTPETFGQLPHLDRGSEPYATYTPVDKDARDERARPTLAGQKLWPNTLNVPTAHKHGPSSPPSLPEAAAGGHGNKSTVVRLWALPPETTFKTALRFHNLRLAELGALLFVLGCGDRAFVSSAADENGRRCLRIGAGKPLGMGHVSIRIGGKDLRPNDDKSSPTLEACWDAFTTHMATSYCETYPGKEWAVSPEVMSFVRSCDAEANANLDFRYMQLTGGPDSYVGAKGGGTFLPPYADELAHQSSQSGQR